MRRASGYLAAGAITTVAVALSCVYLSKLDYSARQPAYSHSDEPRWLVGVFESLGRTTVESIRMVARHNIPDHAIISFGWSRISQRPPEDSASLPKHPVLDASARHEAAAGLPFRSMMGWRDVRSYSPDFTQGRNLTITPSPAAWAIERLDEPIAWADIDPAASLVPLRPIVIGFALDTFFYAFIWFAIISTPRQFIRGRRSARGLCPRCKYDLTSFTSERCSECGNLLRDPIEVQRERVFRMIVVPFWVLTLGLLTTLGIVCATVLIETPIASPMHLSWVDSHESAWVLQKDEGLGSTRLVWIFDDALIDLEKIRERELQRDPSRGRVGYTEAEFADISMAQAKRYESERHALIDERQRIAPAITELAPWWSDRIEIGQGGPDRYKSYMEEARGWPLRCMRLGAILDANLKRLTSVPGQFGFAGFIGGLVIGERPNSNDVTPYIAIPLKPIWLGLVFNTLLFASIWGLLLFGKSLMKSGRSKPRKPGLTGETESSQARTAE